MKKINYFKFKGKIYKTVMLFALVSVYGIYYFSAVCAKNDSNDIYSILKVPHMTPCFSDLRVILAATESLRNGNNPYYLNDTHPYRIRYNYPPVVMKVFDWFGFDQSHTNLLALFLFLSVVVSIFFILNQGNLLNWLIFIALVSPAVALGLERGNSDLIVFCLIICFCLFFHKHAIVSLFILVAAVCFKLYPIILLGLFFLTKDKKNMLLGCLGFSLCFLYIFIIKDYISLIRTTTPLDNGNSFGVYVLGHSIMSAFRMRYSYLILVLPLAFMTVVFGFFYFKQKNRSEVCFKMHELLFLSGASLYVACFMLGSNYNYRLMFLILTIAHLLSEGRKKTRFSFFYILTLVFIFASLWKGILIKKPWLDRVSSNVFCMIDCTIWFMLIYVIFHLLLKTNSSSLHQEDDDRLSDYL